MTTITFKSHCEPISHRLGLHVLTYAEEGFAPLEIHGRKFDVPRTTLTAFSAEVNRANKLGSLSPIAPISAVPRSCIRDKTDAASLTEHFEEFLSGSAGNPHTATLLLDFSTPSLEPHVEAAIMAVFGDGRRSPFKEIVVVRN